MPTIIGNASLGGLTAPGGVRRYIPKVVFMQRMAASARIAVRQAAKTDPYIEDFLDLLAATIEVNLDDPDTLAGVQYLVASELLTQAEAEALLA